MNSEHDALERKSLRLISGSAPDWEAVARECVCFANARGGVLEIGIEDGETRAPAGQRIERDVPEHLFRRVSELTMSVTLSLPTIEQDQEGGGEYLRVVILASHSLACTNDGRYYARVSNQCKPVPPEGMMRLASEKGAFVWELQPTPVPIREMDEAKAARLLHDLRASERVKETVLAKTDTEIIAHYDLCRGDVLTNLGVLWVGRREHRAALMHAPIIQYLRFDERGVRVDKHLFGDDYALNPQEQLEAVRSLAVWQEGVDVPDGLFRDRIPNYDVEVVRELVANALVHRMYTIRGDVYLNLHADRLEVHSPGPLPFGVTPQNILHVSQRRNERLARLFHDLKLMEGEGTGYDRIYDLLLSSGKPGPEVDDSDDRVKVTVRGRDLDLKALRVAGLAADQFPLGERERITLGVLARHGALTTADLARRLALRETGDVKAWLGRLEEFKLVARFGQKRGTSYRVPPRLLKASGYRTRTTLAHIEDHRLRALIRTDVEHFPHSSLGEIRERVGAEIPRARVQRQLRALLQEGEIVMDGTRRWARYALDTPKGV